MTVVVQYPAAARPYPGEVPVPVHEDGVAVPDPGLRPEPAGPEPEAERSCTGTTKAGEPCKGRPGDDGRCAAHKQD
jgi:hypothetical protein